jgi:hypothetical protein
MHPAPCACGRGACRRAPRRPRSSCAAKPAFLRLHPLSFFRAAFCTPSGPPRPPGVPRCQTAWAITAAAAPSRPYLAAGQRAPPYSTVALPLPTCAPPAGAAAAPLLCSAARPQRACRGGPRAPLACCCATRVHGRAITHACACACVGALAARHLRGRQPCGGTLGLRVSVSTRAVPTPRVNALSFPRYHPARVRCTPKPRACQPAPRPSLSGWRGGARVAARLARLCRLARRPSVVTTVARHTPLPCHAYNTICAHACQAG